MISLGVNTVLVKQFSFREAAQAIRLAGYDALEISAIKGMCEHLWVRSIQDGTESLFGMEDALHLTELMEGAYLSFREKRQVEFAELVY